MKYLLDVNALLHFWHAGRAENNVFHEWAARVGLKNLKTCAITEIGFLRVSMSPAYGLTKKEAVDALKKIRPQIGGFIGETFPAEMPDWLRGYSGVTDAYLCQLASSHQMKLATFDRGIADAAAVLIS